MEIKTKIEAFISNQTWSFDAKALNNMLKHAISCHTTQKDEQTISLGASKVGGRPDLPNSQTWFQHNGKSMCFVAQINFSETIGFDIENVLPIDGIAYFFIEVDEEKLIFEKLEKSVVFYSKDIQNLKRAEYPADLSNIARFDSCAIKFLHDFSLPSLVSASMKDLNMNNQDFKQFGELSNYIAHVTNQNSAGEDAMLAYPKSLTSDVAQAWAKIGGKNDYQLLLQIGFMDNNTNMFNFGNSGIAYWGISQENLKNCRFENTILVCQGE